MSSCNKAACCVLVTQALKIQTLLSPLMGSGMLRTFPGPCGPQFLRLLAGDGNHSASEGFPEKSVGQYASGRDSAWHLQVP